MKKQAKIILYGIIGVYILLFYAFMYSDILITTSHSVNFWDILFSGRISDFYRLSETDIKNAGYVVYNNADYDFIVYILFAVWNFPLWIVRKLTNVNIWESALAIAWAKSIILLFTLLSVRCMHKICKTLELSEKITKQVVLLFLTSSLLFSCIFVNSQYDIIYLYIMLEALNYYLKGKLKHFTILMAMTLPIKPFALFMFAPLVLYKEKNVIKIGLHTIGVLAPWLLLKILGPSGIDSGNIDNFLIIFRHKIELGNVTIYTFILFVLLFYLYCYSIDDSNDNEKFQRKSILISFLAFVSFFIICGGNPYWTILMMPFGYLLMGLNERQILLSVIIETIANISVIGSYVWRVPWCYDANTIRSTYVAKIWGYRLDDTDNVLEVIHKYMPMVYDLMTERAEGILFAIFIAGYSILIYVNCCKGKTLAFDGREIPEYVWGIRILLGVGVCMLPFIPYVL